MDKYLCSCGNHGTPEVIEHGLKRFVCPDCGSVITSRQDRIKAKEFGVDLRRGADSSVT